MAKLPELLDCVETTFTIECGACGTTQLSLRRTAPGAAREFENDGWAVVNGDLLCPRCGKSDQ